MNQRELSQPKGTKEPHKTIGLKNHVRVTNKLKRGNTEKCGANSGDC